MPYELTYDNFDLQKFSCRNAPFRCKITPLNKCIGDDTKPAARQAQTAFKKNKTKNISKNDLQYGGWNSFTLQCGKWLCDDMPLNSPKRQPYWNSTSGFDFGHNYYRSRNVILHQSAKFYPNRTTLGRNNDVMSIFKMADLPIFDFRSPIMGSLKSPCTTSYRSSIDNITVNCLFFEKTAFCILASRSNMAMMADLDL